jgi:hypothetical protein
MRSVASFLLLLVFVSSHSTAQNAPLSDPNAVAVVTKTLTTLTDGQLISDVTLTGTATRTAGSDSATGAVTLRAKGVSESRIDLSLSKGSRSEVRNGQFGAPAGAWSGSDNVAHAVAGQNCWTDAAWFFPALSSLTIQPDVVLEYVGQESMGTQKVFHIQAYYFAGSKKTADNSYFQNASLTDWYIDSTTFLPVATSFNVHPDNDSNTNIPVWIGFLSYSSVNGVQVPSRIQKYIQGGLVLDPTLTSAVVNSGLGDFIFSLQ